MDTRLVIADAPMAPLLSAMHAQCFETAWSDIEFERLLAMPGAVCLIALGPDDRPAGYVLASCASDQADIVTIGVLPDARGRGVGQNLLRDLADRLAGAGVRQIFLDVAADNIVAVELYKKAGYSVFGERKNYYSAACGDRRALQMVRMLGT